MFMLRDLPTVEIIERLRKEFPLLDADIALTCIRLLVLGSDLLIRFDNLLGQYDLSHGRWVVLMLLRRRKVWTALPSELAEEQGVTRATMTGLISKLEKQGLVRKEEDPEDGRRTVVLLTAAGAELVGRILPNAYKLAVKALSALGPEEKKQFRALLEKLMSVRV